MTACIYVPYSAADSWALMILAKWTSSSGQRHSCTQPADAARQKCECANCNPSKGEHAEGGHAYALHNPGIVGMSDLPGLSRGSLCLGAVLCRCQQQIQALRRHCHAHPNHPVHKAR
jgi:hypothetical protein